MNAVQHNHLFRLLPLFIVIILALTGCVKVSQPMINEPKQTTLTQPAPLLEMRLLDGAPTNQEKTKLTPIALVIDNFPESRPPIGLEKASIVYEVPMEAGITRFLTVFDPESLPDKIGPIRSARPYMAELAEEYRGLLVHCGGSPEFLLKVKNHLYSVYNIDEISGDGQYFKRDNFRKAPFNLYISAQAVKNILLNKKIPLEGSFKPWQFIVAPEGEIRNQIDGSEVQVNYREPVTWRYEPNSGLYIRWQGGQQSSAASGQVIGTKNLVLQIADIKVVDEIGRRQIDLKTGGQAVIFQGGQRIEGSWKKNNGRTIFSDSFGQEIKFISGNVWVEIISAAQID